MSPQDQDEDEVEGGGRKKPRSNTKSSWEEVSLEQMQPCLHLTVENAQKTLNIKKWEFYKICKKLGLQPWPGPSARALARCTKIVEEGKTNLPPPRSTSTTGIRRKGLYALKYAKTRLANGTISVKKMGSVADSIKKNALSGIDAILAIPKIPLTPLQVAIDNRFKEIRGHYLQRSQM
jgi:hypothetical protein